MENLVVDSEDKRQPELIDKGGVKIPKLDFTSIYIQREVVSSQNEGESNDDDNGDNGDGSDSDSYYKEDGNESD